MEVKLSKQQKITVNSAEDIYLIMRQILRRENKIGQGQEHFWMVGLNQANKILYIELVALGSSNMAGINPREAFRMAIYKLAVQVIMVHNHPGGNVTPSYEDQDLTDHFIQAGKFLKALYGFQTGTRGMKSLSSGLSASSQPYGVLGPLSTQT